MPIFAVVNLIVRTANCNRLFLNLVTLISPGFRDILLYQMLGIFAYLSTAKFFLPAEPSCCNNFKNLFTLGVAVSFKIIGQLRTCQIVQSYYIYLIGSSGLINITFTQ